MSSSTTSSSSVTKYSIGDQLSIVDANGKVYRCQIDSIAKYATASKFDSIDVLAASYSSINSGSVNHTTTYFYLCSNLSDETPEFTNKVFWDAIIDTDKTTYITKSSTYQIVITPIKGSDGYYRDIDDIITSIKTAISSNVTDCTISYTDVTDSDVDELTKMKAAVEVAQTFLDEYSNLESLRPLLTSLTSLNITSLTSDIETMLTDIQARLAQIDATSSS